MSEESCAFTTPDPGKSPSQHVSEVLGNILQGTFKEFKTEIHKITQTIEGLKTLIHDPPCEYMEDLKREVNEIRDQLREAKKREQDKIAREEELKIIRRKFLYNVATIVVASAVIFGAGAILYALRNGFNG
jgi:hypothetical protein